MSENEHLDCCNVGDNKHFTDQGEDAKDINPSNDETEAPNSFEQQPNVNDNTQELHQDEEINTPTQEEQNIKVEEIDAQPIRNREPIEHFIVEDEQQHQQTEYIQEQQQHDALNLSQTLFTDDEDSQTLSVSSPRLQSMTFEEEEGRIKGDEYIDPMEAKKNFYKDRIHLNHITKLIDPTKTFVFKEHFVREKSEHSISGKAIKCTIVEEIETLSREPKNGLFPPDFDEKTYNEVRYSASYKHFLPSKFAPQPPQLKRLEYFTRQETITSWHEMNRPDPHNVLLINISGIPSNMHNLHEMVCDFCSFKSTCLHKDFQLSRFVNCQFLALRGCGISSVKGIVLPNLRVCNLSDNQISQHLDIVSMISHCKLLQHLVVKGNPFERNTDWKDTIICNAPDLLSLNDLPVTILERQKAIDRKGSPEQQQRFSFLKWDWAINYLCERMRLLTWEPEKFTSLNLRQARLKEFHVGVFPKLKKLDISYNDISSLLFCGLERCDKLQEFDFSHNRIDSEDSLNVLQYIPCLKKVNSIGNPLPKSYELCIIYFTSHLKGTNTVPGLQELNGVPVSIDLRARAASKYGNQNIQQLKWYYCIIKAFGHYQLRYIPDFAQRVRILEVTNETGILQADLSSFKSLQYVDLRNNDLEKIVGLSRLKNLKFLDISGNPRMSHDEVVESLAKLAHLRHVILGESNVRRRGSSAMTSSTDSFIITPRMEILLKLLVRNMRLFALNNKEITLRERLEAHPFTRMSVLEISRYKFHLALVYQVVPFNERIFTDKMVKPTSGLYNPANIKILHLSNLKLKHSSFDFEPFVNLEKLDVSNNGIKNVLNIKLECCVRLEVLDMANNQIRNSISEVTELLNVFKNLEIVVFRGNPFTQTAGYRENLLKGLRVMLATSPTLKILDSEITSKDRQMVWDFHNLNTQEEEQKRFKVAMKQRGYLDIESYEDISSINLNDSALKTIELLPYSNIQILLLRGNRIRSLKNTGILDMRRLRCVDLRNNKLSAIDEVIRLIRSNTDLETIGLKLSNQEDSNFAKVHDYRELVIKQCPSLRNPYSKFWEIDAREISIDEIEANWPEPVEEIGPEEEQRIYSLFRFNSVIFRKYTSIFRLTKPLEEIKVVPERIQCLDLSNQGLWRVDFSAFSNLKKLSLKGNLLDDQALLDSNLVKIGIEELDIQDNEIKVLDTLSAFVDTCPCLRMLFTINNPCYPPAKRRQIRKQFLRILNKTVHPGWIFFLNGTEVTIRERCNALKKDYSLHEVESIRMDLTLAEEKYTGQETVLILSNRQLQVITRIVNFNKLTELDLSGNKLHELPDAIFKQLRYLVKLDLRSNNLKSVDHVIDCIGQSHSLRILFLEKAGPLFQEKQEYAIEIFKSMRVLSSLDNIPNPFPMGNDQRLSLQYLATFGISPNHLRDIDIQFSLGKKQFWAILIALNTLVLRWTKDDSYVGPRTIRFNSNKFKNWDYRFLLIQHISSLEEIDMIPINETERNQVRIRSEKLTKAIEEHRTLFHDSREHIVGLSDKVTFENVRKSIMAQKSFILGSTKYHSQSHDDTRDKWKWTLRRSKKIDSKAASDKNTQIETEEVKLEEIEVQHSTKCEHHEISIPSEDTSDAVIVLEPSKEPTIEETPRDTIIPMVESTNFEDLKESDIDFRYIEHNFRTIPLLYIYRQLMEQRGKQTISTVIGALDKIEILIYFLQLFGIVYSFNVPWPATYALIAKYITFSLLSLETVFPNGIPAAEYYIKFILMMILPLIFLTCFLLNFSRKRFQFMFVRFLPVSLFVIVALWIIGYAGSFVLALTSYPESFVLLGNRKKLPSNVYWNLGLFCILVTLVGLVLFVGVILFRIKHEDESFWYNFYTKLRQRLCLLLVSIFYFPVFREIFVTYECSGDHLRLYSDEKCPHNVSQAPPMYYISAIMGLLYGIGIPLLFIIVIQMDSSFVYRDYGIRDDYAELKRKKDKLATLSREHGSKNTACMELQSYIEKKEKSLVKKYRDAIREHNSSASILYVSYKYWFRFFKVFQLFERIIMCCLASIIAGYTKVQAPVGFSVLLVYGLVSIITRPYLDGLTNVIDISTHLVNFLNLLFGYILVRKDDISAKWMKFGDVPASSILYSINGLNGVIVVSIIIFHPIRVRITKARNQRKRREEAGLLKDKMRENNEELNHTQVVRTPLSFYNEEYDNVNIDLYQYQSSDTLSEPQLDNTHHIRGNDMNITHED